MSTQTITEFLEARISDDESEAWGAEYFADGGWPEECAKRVLAECAAKRAIIEQAGEASSAYSQVVGAFSMSYEQQAEMDRDPGELILRALAAVYADHNEFQQEWKL